MQVASRWKLWRIGWEWHESGGLALPESGPLFSKSETYLSLGNHIERSRSIDFAGGEMGVPPGWTGEAIIFRRFSGIMVSSQRWLQ